MTPNTRALEGQSYCSQRWAIPVWPKGSKSRGFSTCKLNGVLKSNNNRLLAYLMMQLSCYNYIAYEWQSVIANNRLVLAKIKDKHLTRSDLSSATDNVKCIYPKGYEIIDKYIKQLQKG